MSESRLQPVWGDAKHQMARDLRVLIRDVLKTEKQVSQLILATTLGTA